MTSATNKNEKKIWEIICWNKPSVFLTLIIWNDNELLQRQIYKQETRLRIWNITTVLFQKQKILINFEQQNKVQAFDWVLTSTYNKKLGTGTGTIMIQTTSVFVACLWFRNRFRRSRQLTAQTSSVVHEIKQVNLLNKFHWKRLLGCYKRCWLISNH